MKIDLFHQIQYESVYRGLTPLSREEIENIYGGSYIPQYMIRAGNEVKAYFSFVNLEIKLLSIRKIKFFFLLLLTVKITCLFFSRKTVRSN